MTSSELTVEYPIHIQEISFQQQEQLKRSTANALIYINSRPAHERIVLTKPMIFCVLVGLIPEVSVEKLEKTLLRTIAGMLRTPFGKSYVLLRDTNGVHHNLINISATKEVFQKYQSEFPESSQSFPRWSQPQHPNSSVRPWFIF
jgi:hypothetical protein